MPQATLNFNYLDKRTINALYEDCFCITSLENSNVITIKINNTHDGGYPSGTFSFSYSTDNGYTWTDITIKTSSDTWKITEIDSSKNFLLRGNGNTTLEGLQIMPSKTYNASGNILSLLDGDYSKIDKLEDYCFDRLFYRSNVKDASLNLSFNNASFKSGYFDDSIGYIPENTIGFIGLYPGRASTVSPSKHIVSPTSTSVILLIDALKNPTSPALKLFFLISCGVCLPNSNTS